MKRILAMLVIFITAECAVHAAEYADVLYLKNGSRVKGVIVENELNTAVKIETRDGSIFVFRYDEIAKIGREKAAVREMDADRTMTLNAYEGAKKSWWTGTGLACLLLPGLGHVYAKEYAYGAMYLGLDLALLGGCIYSSVKGYHGVSSGFFYALLASRVVELVHLDYVIDRYNARIRESLGVGPEISLHMGIDRPGIDAGNVLFAACAYRF